MVFQPPKRILKSRDFVRRGVRKSAELASGTRFWARHSCLEEASFFIPVTDILIRLLIPAELESWQYSRLQDFMGCGSSLKESFIWFVRRLNTNQHDDRVANPVPRLIRTAPAHEKINVQFIVCAPRARGSCTCRVLGVASFAHSAHLSLSDGLDRSGSGPASLAFSAGAAGVGQHPTGLRALGAGGDVGPPRGGVSDLAGWYDAFSAEIFGSPQRPGAARIGG